ncbi:MAG TPA: sugar phosphate isomerase/epimerase [Chloroflexota bacterium]|jgi:sugar phosphate isomerase/epimerase
MGLKLAVSSYSFHRFGYGSEGKEAPSVERMIERCAEWGIDGIEILGFHLQERAREQLYELKRLALRRGVAIVSVSANHNFVEPDPEERRRQVDTVARWVDAAHELGAPVVRAFGGRWNTLDWHAFMAARGEEPPREGCSDEDAYRWSVEAFRVAGYYAGRKGVTLAVENHWGLTGRAAGVLRLLEETGSPWLGVALDTGNFPFVPDMYAEMAELLPRAVMVHAKTYRGGGMHYAVEIDYRRVAAMLREADFRGYVSLEHEGNEHPDRAIPASVTMLREAFAP